MKVYVYDAHLNMHQARDSENSPVRGSNIRSKHKIINLSMGMGMGWGWGGNTRTGRLDNGDGDGVGIGWCGEQKD